ncbi:MAG: Xaa-Pro peptidase family protein [Gammaproteobacteria bacterium]|nr:Xaa-Pro peptidase family protein [Gammaproteobacteria bacterium]
MSLHFNEEEFSQRQSKVCQALNYNGLDGVLLFRQESMYYLTGYDTSGYTMFQAMFLSTDGKLFLMTRSADRLQSRLTSVIEDIRIWEDGDGANPAIDLRNLLEEYECRNQHIGIEYHAYGLTAQRGRMVDHALEGFCTTSDASDIVRDIRLVKSDAELAYVRKAGEICDQGWQIANSRSVPGAFLGDIYGEMMQVIMSADGDPSASRWPMGAGEDALMIRYHTGKNTIGENDQVQHEFAGAYRHYHTAAMSVVVTGKPKDIQRSMFSACHDTLQACKQALRPGTTVGDIYKAHVDGLTTAGFGHATLKACGYSMGISYPPTWMDWPMIWRDHPDVIQPGMVFFMHMILLDDKTGLTMSLGETCIVTDGACEPVNHAPDELVVN